jgi:hypothetical protein
MTFHPQTPQSPSQSSPGTTDPSSSTISSSSVTAITTALPTPAHSVNGSTSQPSDMSHDIIMGEESPNKRKRSLADLGDREQKKVHIEDGKFGMEDLHLDVGEKYLLCRTRKTPFTAPPFSHNHCTILSFTPAPCRQFGFRRKLFFFLVIPDLMVNLELLSSRIFRTLPACER